MDELKDAFWSSIEQTICLQSKINLFVDEYMKNGDPYVAFALNYHL